jgi:purine nucleosidase
MCWSFWVDRIFTSREALGGSFIHLYSRRADHVHGSNGIGDIELPHPETRTTEEHAGDLLIRIAKENPAEITLCSGDPSPTSRWLWSRR